MTAIDSAREQLRAAIEARIRETDPTLQRVAEAAIACATEQLVQAAFAAGAASVAMVCGHA